jgi:Bacterial membrane protein YfhO
VHAALEAQDAARPEQPARTRSDRSGTQQAVDVGEASLWLAGLLVTVSLAVADGLLGKAVAYERDTTVFYFPLMSWVGQQLQHGYFPLWTPQFFGGYPIFADGEIGLAYPPMLLTLLTMSPERAFITMRVLHLCLAAAGMFLLARTWRLPYPSAFLAGLVFALGNFLQAQIHHENIVRTASWLPLVLACVEIALRSESWRRRLRWTILAALALGLAGLSLHSQVLAMELLILAAYTAFRWGIGPLGTLAQVNRRSMVRFVSVARVSLPVVLLGLALAAVQLLPLIELAGFSARGNGIPYAQAAAYSVTPVGLLQLVFPYFFRGQGSLQWGLWTHWESYVYIGLAPLVLTIVALVCVRRREVLGWAVTGALGLILSLGQYSPINIHYFLWLLPGLSGLRAPGRFTFVVVLAAAMVSAYGLAWLLKPEPDAHEARRLSRLLGALGIATVLLAVVLAAVHVGLSVWPQPARAAIQDAYLSLPRDTYPLTVNDVMAGLSWSTDFGNPRVLMGLFGLVVVTALVWLWQRPGAARGARTRRLWPALLLALTALDLLTFGWAIHPREPLAKVAAEPAAVQMIEQLPGPDAAPNRVLASPALNQVSPDRLAPFGSLEEANGYSSLQFVWHRDYLGRVLYADDALLDLWGVRYILDPIRYGKLSMFDGVEYLPQQALLHSPAGGALSEQTFAVASNAPIVGLRFVSALQGAVQVSQGAPVAEVELRDNNNQVVATAELQAGRDAMDWAWDLPAVQASVQHRRVQSAGTTNEAGGPEPTTRQLSYAEFALDRPVMAATITVRATPPAGEFVLYGGATVASDGSLGQLFGKTNTKYRQVYSDSEIRVLEDTAAFPRAFIVPDARVAPSLGTALSQMVHQPFNPDQEVILADDTSTQSTGLSGNRGGHGRANVTTYEPGEVTVHTSTDAAAWLVLTDTYYPGWTAYLDGQPATVLRGDVLFRVVPVPSGEHEVALRFEPDSVKLGLGISLAAVTVVVLCLLISGVRPRRRRTT